LEDLVKYRRVYVYDLAKHAPFAASTIYYMLERLRDEGYAEQMVVRRISVASIFKKHVRLLVGMCQVNL